MRGLLVSLGCGWLAAYFAGLWADHAHITFDQGFPILLIGLIAGMISMAVD